MSAQKSRTQRRAAQVLVSEDDPDVSALERRHLRALGHHVDIADTGEDGLAAAAHQSPMAAVGFGAGPDDGPQETS